MKKSWQALLLVVTSLAMPVAKPMIQPALAFSAPGDVVVGKPKIQVDNREEEVRQLLMDLAKAVNAGDVEKTLSLWSDDAVFVDQAGNETKGKSDLRKRFANLLPQRADSPASFHPEKISFPGPNVALVVGCVSLKNGSLDLPASRFSFALVKQNGAWQIAQHTETSIQETSAADHLKDLEWLIGQWQVDKGEQSPKLDVDWADGKNFIITKITITKDGASHVDRQIIGWDGRSRSIVSWHFNADGSFGYGRWTKQDGRWLVNFSGTATDGSSSSSLNIFAPGSADEFTWQSTEQNNGGTALPDTAILKVRRAKP